MVYIYIYINNIIIYIDGLYYWQSINDLAVICSLYILVGCTVNGVVMFERLCVVYAYGRAVLLMEYGLWTIVCSCIY